VGLPIYLSKEGVPAQSLSYFSFGSTWLNSSLLVYIVSLPKRDLAECFFYIVSSLFLIVSLLFAWGPKCLLFYLSR